MNEGQLTKEYIEFLTHKRTGCAFFDFTVLSKTGEVFNSSLSKDCLDTASSKPNVLRTNNVSNQV